MQKLAIVGSHRDTRTHAPYDDPSYDIWVFNEAAQNDWCKRWTACFQMHRSEIYMSRENVNNRDHWDWLQQDHRGKVIYMQDMDELVPNSRRYPLDEIIATFPAAQPIPGSTFLTSTAAMALALALYLGYQVVEVYGVDLSSNTEYASQQSCWLYWVGVAKAILGNNLILHSGEHLYRARVYGYDGEVQLDRALYQERAEKWVREKESVSGQIYKVRDRLSASITEYKPDKFTSLIIEAQNALYALGVVDGHIAEAKRYAERTDPISAQEFERTGAQAQLDCGAAQGEQDKRYGTVEYVFNIWRQTANPQAAHQLRMFASELLRAAEVKGRLQGVMEENMYLMGEYNERARAAGGVRALKTLGMMA